MSSISIPEPCHENWAEFTPTQKGAFCGSCQIDVVDFSGKSPEEVKVILKENAGKHLCGRFRKSQLDDLNYEFYTWENQSVKSFQSKFLYACLIVFGMSLFTSCNVSEQSILGEIRLEQSEDETHLSVVKPLDDNAKDTTKTNKNNYRKGKIKYEPVTSDEILLGKPSIDESENFLPADSLEKTMIPDPQHYQIIGNVPDENSSLNEDTLYTDEMVDGEIEWTSRFEEFVEDTVQIADSIKLEDKDIHVKGEIVLERPIDTEPILENETKDSVIAEPVNGSSSLSFPGFEINFDAELFPNPVQDKTTVIIHVKDSDIFSLYLYAITGKKVKDIYSGMLGSGRNEFTIDLAGYESGSYLIVISSGKQKESLKLEKLR